MKSKDSDILFDYSHGVKTLEIYKKHRVNGRSLKKILDGYSVPRKIMGFDKYQILIDYSNKMPIDEICKKHNMIRDSLYRLLKREKVSTHITYDGGTPEDLKKYDAVDYICMNKDTKDYRYIKICPKCKNKSSPCADAIRRLSEEKLKKWVCAECIKETYPNLFSARGIKKNNTSGFIGISVFKNQKTGEVAGYSSGLIYKKFTLLKNRYKDPFLQEITLIRAAVDRDLFIIEHALPHHRNLSDIQLINYIKTLGIEELEYIKKFIAKASK